jgi:hypothetical protein
MAMERPRRALPRHRWTSPLCFLYWACCRRCCRLRMVLRSLRRPCNPQLGHRVPSQSVAETVRADLRRRAVHGGVQSALRQTMKTLLQTSLMMLVLKWLPGAAAMRASAKRNELGVRLKRRPRVRARLHRRPRGVQLEVELRPGRVTQRTNRLADRPDRRRHNRRGRKGCDQSSSLLGHLSGSFVHLTGAVPASLPAMMCLTWSRAPKINDYSSLVPPSWMRLRCFVSMPITQKLHLRGQGVHGTRA